MGRLLSKTIQIIVGSCAKKKHVPTAMKVNGEETRAHHKKAHVITT